MKENAYANFLASAGEPAKKPDMVKHMFISKDNGGSGYYGV